MEFGLLGPLTVSDGGVPIAIGGGKRRALLALLLLHRNQVVQPADLIDALWEERPPATASKTLQVYVSQLRKELGSASQQVLRTNGSGYVVVIGEDDLDVDRFARAGSRAAALLEQGDLPGALSVADDALRLWRGRPLSEFAGESFAQHEIARLDEARIRLLELRVDVLLAARRNGDALAELEALVSEHRLHERFRGQIMLALYRAGRQAEALQVYRDTRALLDEELGLEPTPELRSLEAAILRQDASLDLGPAPPVARHPPPSREPLAQARRRWRLGRWPLLAAVVGALLAVAGGLAIAERDGGAPAAARPFDDPGPNSLVSVTAAGRQLRPALPLPGRPTAVAAGEDVMWIASVDSAAVTAVDVGRGRIVRTVPLSGHPDAVAVGAGRVWVADGGRGALTVVRPGYGGTQELRFPRARQPVAGRGSVDRALRAAIAVGGDDVFVANGSAQVHQVIGDGSSVIAVGAPVSDVVWGHGALWALSPSHAAVLRIDGATRQVTDRIPLARPGAESPFPVRIVANATGIWVLSRNTATVTRIDPRTRGVVSTVPVGIDRVPADLGAGAVGVWTANRDGSLSYVTPGSPVARSVWIGTALSAVAVQDGTIWVASSPLDDLLPGGDA
jgi:DNA-binding SARP family transcriptional activator